MKQSILLISIVLLVSCQTQRNERTIYGSNKSAGHYLEVNDIKVYYEVYGEGEPLLLLHGGGGSIENYSYQIPELSKHFKVYAIDSRGHGRTTDSDQELTYSLMAEDVSYLIDRLKLGNVNVLGWSDGGNTGLELAFAHPDKVKKLIISGANFTHENCSAGDDSVKMDPDDPLILRMKPFLKKFIENGQRLSPDTSRAASFRKKLERLWSNYPNFTTSQLKFIKAPTLVISGDHDLFTFEHTVTLYKSLANSQLFVVPGASHLLLIEKPEVVNPVIIKFLETPFMKINNLYFMKLMNNLSPGI